MEFEIPVAHFYNLSLFLCKILHGYYECATSFLGCYDPLNMICIPTLEVLPIL